MYSFHHSRGRILFEVLCALTVSASCAGAWIQTGAWALLPATAAALFYSVVHLFDLSRRSPVVAAEPQQIEFATDDQGDLLDYVDAGVPLAAADQQPTTDNNIEETELVEPAAPRASGGGRGKAPRKGGSRRSGGPRKAEITELAPPEPTEITELAPPEAAEVTEFAPPEEVAHVPLVPLFEPEPFARQQRAVFGRKAG